MQRRGGEEGRLGGSGGPWGLQVPLFSGSGSHEVVRPRETPSVLYSEELLRTVPWRMTLERGESRLEEGKGLALVRREVTNEGHSAGLSDGVTESGQGPGQPLRSRWSEGSDEKEVRMERG